MARPKSRPGRRDLGFVLDNSIVMAWSFADESDAYADSVLDRLVVARAAVPSLWPLEVANALLMGERRRRSTESDTIHWIGILTRLPIVVDDQTNTRAWGDTLALARGHKLTAYDAAYLELAIRLRLPLASLDDPLKAAASSVGIPLFDTEARPPG